LRKIPIVLKVSQVQGQLSDESHRNVCFRFKNGNKTVAKQTKVDNKSLIGLLNKDGWKNAYKNEKLENTTLITYVKTRNGHYVADITTKTVNSVNVFRIYTIIRC